MTCEAQFDLEFLTVRTTVRIDDVERCEVIDERSEHEIFFDYGPCVVPVVLSCFSHVLGDASYAGGSDRWDVHELNLDTGPLPPLVGRPRRRPADSKRRILAARGPDTGAATLVVTADLIDGRDRGDGAGSTRREARLECTTSFSAGQ